MDAARFSPTWQQALARGTYLGVLGSVVGVSAGLLALVVALTWTTAAALAFSRCSPCGTSALGVVITAGWLARAADSSPVAAAGDPARARAAITVTPAAGSPAANRRVKLMKGIRSVAVSQSWSGWELSG